MVASASPPDVAVLEHRYRGHHLAYVAAVASVVRAAGSTVAVGSCRNISVVDRFLSDGELSRLLQSARCVFALTAAPSGIAVAAAAHRTWIVAAEATPTGRAVERLGLGVTSRVTPAALADAIDRVGDLGDAPPMVDLPTRIEFGERVVHALRTVAD